jgi:serine/threonine protein kinase
VNKTTGQHAAVKIIDKATIEPEEKGLLRSEIAVLKLVNHPNIIRMEGLYESKNYIYIVMEMLKGGELFERIVGRPRYVVFTHSFTTRYYTKARTHDVTYE